MWRGLDPDSLARWAKWCVVTGQEDAQQEAQCGDDDAGKEGCPEPRDGEPANQCRNQQHQGVDHQQEEPRRKKHQWQLSERGA